MVAIICECNPFHNGHQYLFETAKRLTGEPVLAIMSGSFTQRGEVAVCSKFERAKIALEYGADLVVELPTVCAVARAQRFAQGGVSIADAFGAHYLAFGCECDDLSALRQAAFALSRADVNGEIARLMKNGAYYPQAVERAVRAVCGDRAADVLTAPNNILAAEYIRALVGSDIKPLPVRRVGVAHDSEIPSGGYCSASRLRALLRAGERVSDYLPEAPREITDPALTERAILFRLRSMTAGDFRKLPEVGEGLEHRLADAVARCGSVEAILSSAKTKRYTHARLRRILCCAALDITESLQARSFSYARVLGFTPEGAALLKNCAFETVTSPAKTLRRGGDNVDFLRADIRATDLASLAYPRVKPCGLDFHTKIIAINRAK